MKDVGMIVYIVMSLATIGVLTGLYIKAKGKEGYCVCRGAGSGPCNSCTNPEAQRKAYENGLTEYYPQIRGAPINPMPVGTRFQPYADTGNMTC